MNLGGALFQNLFGLIRVMLFFGIPAMFAISFSSGYHQVNATELAENLLKTNIVFQFLPFPRFIAGIVAPLTEPLFFRYLLPPVISTIAVLFAGAFYVKDIYGLRTFRSSLRYVIASMFAIVYPSRRIDLAVARRSTAEGGTGSPRGAGDNLIDGIGGPGIVQVEPGSGAFFRLLRGRLSWEMATNRFLEPFERVAQEVDLNDQQGDRDNIPCVTRDGIQVRLCDVHFRYRIRMAQPVRNQAVPFPFNQEALPRLILGLLVQDNGVETWQAAVERAVTGQITDYIAANTIDYLTAPRSAAWNPREELCENLFRTARVPLENMGAELIWADVGHLEIVDNRVDDQRTNLWAAPWMGDANATRAFGDAIRQSYQEMGRAEAQAEMIIGISNALSGVGAGTHSPESIRRLLLARTSQMLDAMHINLRERERQENS